MDLPRPAAQLVADAAREWVARNHGPSVSPVVVTIYLSNGETHVVPVAGMAVAKSPRNRHVSDDCLGDIVAILGERGTAMTARQILTALERAGQSRSESTVKHTLAYFVRAGRIVNGGDGYVLPGN